MAKHHPMLIAVLCGAVVVLAKYCSESNFAQRTVSAAVSVDGKAPVMLTDPWVKQVHLLPKTKNGDRIFTSELLKRFQGTGSPNSKEIYLAILGVVYNVTDGREYYEGNDGYGCFSGRDASRAFVTGEFKGDGVTDSLEGLSATETKAVKEWQDFYEKHETYCRLGLLPGKYYDEQGQPTAALTAVEEMLAEAERQAAKEKEEMNKWPTCNSKWQKGKGSTFWCSEPEPRVPRNFTRADRNNRCACVTIEQAESLKEFMHVYRGCGPQDLECTIPDTG